MFIRIPKTAGTSVGEALCATPVWESLARDQIHSVLDRAEKEDASIQTLHWSADELASEDVGVVGHPYVDGAACFTVVRNPWDRAYAYWKFIQRDERDLHEEWTHPDFEEWCGLLGERHAPTRESAWRPDLNARQRLEPQTSWSSAIEDPDDVLRYEDIEAEFDGLCARHGLFSTDLPHLNAAPERVDYRNRHTPTTREAVAVAWGSDAEVFGYDY
jgi:hypothetical protein